ncbi:type II secretion system F family protein [Roseovarius faecimaris]|uniref:Type II secretion system F family protein n=1 Tax=Roseovarius faecimaris TaxID=2494550 RepID=A0A6I6IT04_9RHOB|nr:type II secretion system F family protein [Roseovarius faecimaris]QGY00210.1 type II secretion system F family protein [Roseovarius faecimaris]
MFSNPIVFYGLIFAATLLLIDGIIRLVASSRRKKSDVVNRLEAIKKKTGVEEAYGELLRRRGMGGRDGEQTIGNQISSFIGQTGLELSLTTRVAFFFGTLCLAYLLSVLFFRFGTVMTYVFTISFPFVMAFLALNYVRNRRIKTFTRQLPEAIDIVVRSLNAGHPLTAAIGLVAREMPDPLGSEFGILNDQMTFGSELEQAMLNMYDRVGAPELNLLTVSVSVQRGTGGNLAEILSNLGQMIRDRLTIKAKIKAISAEGRITAWIMLLFPFALFYMILFLVPTYYDKVWESGYGAYIVTGCLIAIFMGMLVIRRLVNFDF